MPEPLTSIEALVLVMKHEARVTFFQETTVLEVREGVVKDGKITKEWTRVATGRGPSPALAFLDAVQQAKDRLGWKH